MPIPFEIDMNDNALDSMTSAFLSHAETAEGSCSQIEPATFTPSWFALLLRSDGSNSETLNTILNLLLHYYRHSLSDVCIAGELPIPAIPSTASLPLQSLTSFLKLILGVAVSCPNKLLFISKIQSLDETTQHTLTACVASFIATVQELCSQPDPGPAQARDEVWQQKCHELDFQVRINKYYYQDQLSLSWDIFCRSC